MYRTRCTQYAHASSKESTDDEAESNAVLSPSQESKDDDIGKNAALAHDETHLDEGTASARETQTDKEETSDAEHRCQNRRSLRMALAVSLIQRPTR